MSTDLFVASSRESVVMGRRGAKLGLPALRTMTPAFHRKSRLVECFTTCLSLEGNVTRVVVAIEGGVTHVMVSWDWMFRSRSA